MAEEPVDLTAWLEELTARSVNEQVQSIHRYNQLLQKVASGNLDPMKVREEYIRFATEESIRYQRNLSAISLGYFNSLMDLNREFGERFFKKVLEEAEANPPGSKEVLRADLKMHGKQGDTLRAAFLIDNKHMTPLDVSFRVSEFRGEGADPFRPPLRVTPANVKLATKQEQRIDLELPLLPDLFQEGRMYTATIEVLGQNCELLLEVTVDRTEPPAPEPKPKKPRSARKPRAG